MWLFGRHDPLDVVEEALKRRKWKYERVDAYTILTGVAAQSGHPYFIVIRHEEQKKTVLFLFNPLLKSADDALRILAAGKPPFLRVHTDEGHSTQQVSDLCQFLMHQNYRIVLGCFERDERDGEVRYRIAIPYRDTSLTIEQVYWCIDVAVGTLEATMPDMKRIIGAERMAV